MLICIGIYVSRRKHARSQGMDGCMIWVLFLLYYIPCLDLVIGRWSGLDGYVRRWKMYEMCLDRTDG
jgi:hypothetical protein